MAKTPPLLAGNHGPRSACPTKGLVDSKKFLLVDCARLNAFRNEFKNCRIFLLGVPPIGPFGGDRYQRSFMRTCVREREEGFPVWQGNERKRNNEKRDEMVKVARERRTIIHTSHTFILRSLKCTKLLDRSRFFVNEISNAWNYDYGIEVQKIYPIRRLRKKNAISNKVVFDFGIKYVHPLQNYQNISDNSIKIISSTRFKGYFDTQTFFETFIGPNNGFRSQLWYIKILPWSSHLTN